MVEPITITEYLKNNWVPITAITVLLLFGAYNFIIKPRLQQKNVAQQPTEQPTTFEVGGTNHQIEKTMELLRERYEQLKQMRERTEEILFAQQEVLSRTKAEIQKTRNQYEQLRNRLI